MSRATLRGYLARLPDFQPPAAVILIPDANADCRIVREIRHDIEELMRCGTTGLCGEGDGDWE